MTEVEKILPHIATIHDLNGAMGEPTGQLPAVMSLADWTVRLAARCILVDPKTKRIALQQLDTESVIKIPGGGLQYDSGSVEGESFERSVVREIAEETGIDASRMLLEPLGMVIEYRTEWKMGQISYCYVGKISEDEPFAKPLEEGSHLVWADTPAHALSLIRENDLDTYDKRFMRQRDEAILEFYQSISTAI